MPSPIENFYTAVEQGNLPLLESVLSPSWQMIPTVYPGQPDGAAGYWPIVQAFNAAFPDAHFEILEIIEAGSRSTVRTLLRATGKQSQFHTIDIPL